MRLAPPADHHSAMKRNPLYLIAVALMFVSTTSCSVTKRPISSLYFAEQASETAATPSPEMVALSESISSKLGMELSYPENDLGLYAFVADWLRTPYRFGGMSRRGTDCSGFVYRLYETVYETNIGRQSSADLMSQTERVSRNDLREGDLVFFNIRNRRGGRASHVGVYLEDGKFAHASTRSGVIISRLSEPYYRRTYLGAGRVKK